MNRGESRERGVPLGVKEGVVELWAKPRWKIAGGGSVRGVELGNGWMMLD